MKEKIRIALTLFLMIGIILISCGGVNAHSVDLDSKSLISFPIMITNGKGNITIKSSETAYSLYYQAVEISNTNYTQMEQISDNGKTELNFIETEMSELDKTCDDLKAIYDEAYEKYKKTPENGTLQEAFETAKINYQNKVKEYNDKVKEYNNKANEINSKIKELIPTYIENNWKETKDGSFSVDLSQFSGNKAFAIWVKLVSSDGTISYDEATYTMSGTKVEEAKVSGITLDKTTLALQVGSSYTLTATITPSSAIDKSIVWTSSNENIVTVSNGKIMAKAVGTAIITATTKDGNYKATCQVTVSEKASIPSKTKDTTVANGKLPQTGLNMIIVVGILSMIFISIVFYKNYCKYKDLK